MQWILEFEKNNPCKNECSILYNKRRVSEKNQNLIKVGSGTNVGPEIFARLNKKMAQLGLDPIYLANLP